MAEKVNYDVIKSFKKKNKIKNAQFSKLSHSEHKKAKNINYFSHAPTEVEPVR